MGKNPGNPASQSRTELFALTSTQPLNFYCTENTAKARVRAKPMLQKPDIVEIVQLFILCTLYAGIDEDDTLKDSIEKNY